jgi:hypothetical protein
MNVIDYFTEKWNEKKSDGQCGEKKQFRYKNIEFEKKKLNGFEKGKDQKEFEYLDYRNTKTQKVRKYLVDDNKTIYNKRKLSEFVNLINMLHDDENKVELFKKHIYFNYEFMTSKAESCEMIFVVSMNETILKLGDEELSDISQIYVDQFPFIEQDPKTLIFNILSRLESRTDNVRQFAASNNLLLLNSYKKKDIERELFNSGKTRTIVYFWIIKDSPFLLLMTDTECSSHANLHLINANTKQYLGKIDLDPGRIFNPMVIVINNESLNDLNKIFQLNGRVYFVAKKTFYSINFQNDISIIHKFNESIYQLYFLNANIFAFRFNKKIVLLKINIDKKASIQQEIEFPTSDFYLRFTEPAHFVHSDSYLPIRNLKIITYNKKITNLIKIFQFNTESQKLELFCEFEIDIAIQCERPLLIDESYLNDNIETHNHHNEMIRFAIITADNFFKVIEAKKNNEYSIVGSVTHTFSRCFGIMIDLFFENIIVAKMYRKDGENKAFIYDIGKYY